MVIQVVDVLISVAASILPNLGFGSGTYLFKKHFSCWHIPLKSDVEAAILTLLTASADIPNLKEERDELQTKLETLRKSSGSMDKEAQEQICRYAEKLVRVNKELNEKEKQFINWDMYKETVQASGVAGFPKIFWVMTAANSIMGAASYLIWRSYDNFYSLASYGSMLLLYWTYYPVLFTFGWKNLSAAHASLTCIAAGMTSYWFWSNSKMAGVMMLPFLGVLTYVSLDIYLMSQDGADVRQFASINNSRVSHITIHI